mmetsp:Transcript_25464/g.83815  ORF Transcript_25464/g.83815 Transcript_25464/m.83815 type:complete len:274 (+) Transcript_25464:214-1035(+)
MRTSRPRRSRHCASSSMTCTYPSASPNSTWKYGKLAGMHVCRPFPLVLMSFLPACWLHSDSASSMALLKYIGASRITSEGTGKHSTTVCAVGLWKSFAVSRKMTSCPLAPNMRMRHFLKLRISFHTSSSTTRVPLPECAIGAISQCPGTRGPRSGSARYAHVPYAISSARDRAGLSKHRVHLFVAVIARRLSAMAARRSFSSIFACDCREPPLFSYISNPPSWWYSSSMSSSFPLKRRRLAMLLARLRSMSSKPSSRRRLASSPRETSSSSAK